MNIYKKIDLPCVQSKDDETLWGVIVDKNLTFRKHIYHLLRKAQYELHALRRSRKFLIIEKAKRLNQFCSFNMDVLQENILF